MSGSVNKVTLVGNLGRDPEISAMQNGDKVVKLSIATSDRWKDKATGEQRERTEWHRVVIFNDALGRIAEQILKKGSTVYIEGQLQTSKYTDQQSGQEKYSTQVVIQRFKGELTLLSSRNETSMNSQNETNAIDQNNFEQPNQNQVSSNIASDLDDEIPF
ncbi:single-stranded DNA-binding protein [Alphaproteobacteria bacterium]|nr:single-stranded DNA-binding protein [Alphaproteobacteria bacterium]MDB9872690.1 single-stranded DNA-binding protein [Alphaproteobacteria bacterium]